MQNTSGGEVDFPVDNATYNLLQSLVSKLEALDTYRTYLGDASGEDASLFRQLIHEDRAHADQLLQVVRRRLSQG